MLLAQFLTARAQAPWTTLVRSDGGIETAAFTQTGAAMVQEQLRFTQVNSSGQPTVQDLSAEKRMFLSPSGETYASINYEGVKDDAEAAALTLYRPGGTVQWTVSHHLLNDVYPANSGAAVAVARNINVLENRVYFFSAQGKQIQELMLPAVRDIQVSASDDRVLINSGTRGLLLFDLQGQHLANLGPAHGWAISSDGRWVVALYGPKMTFFHEGQATYTGEPSGEIVRGVSFSPDNAHLAVYSDHALVVYENPSGKVLLQENLEVSEQYLFTSVALTRGGDCIGTGLARDLGESVQEIGRAHV
jgi:hypothetical protein